MLSSRGWRPPPLEVPSAAIVCSPQKKVKITFSKEHYAFDIAAYGYDYSWSYRKTLGAIADALSRPSRIRPHDSRYRAVMITRLTKQFADMGEPVASCRRFATLLYDFGVCEPGHMLSPWDLKEAVDTVYGDGVYAIDDTNYDDQCAYDEHCTSGEDCASAGDAAEESYEIVSV